MSVNHEKINCQECGQSSEYFSTQEHEFVNIAEQGEKRKFLCGECYQNNSSCKVCNKSVAGINVENNGGKERKTWIGCKKFLEKENCYFICSDKCLHQKTSQEIAEWNKKLKSGDYKKCEKCVKRFEELRKNYDLNYPHAILLIKLIKKEEKFCDICSAYKEEGYYWKIRQQAQAYWDSLNKNEKLLAIVRTDSVHFAKWYGNNNATAEQLAEQKNVPRGIYEEFVNNQKCGICGQEPCRDNKKNNNNCFNNSLVSRDNKENKNNEQYFKINNRASESDLFSEKYKGLISFIIIAFSLFIFLITFLTFKNKKKNKL